MNKKEAFEKIKKLLFQDEVKCSDAKLIDGTIVRWEEELKEGSAISVVDTDGNILPAPDAVHELEDGTKITTVGGLVTLIEPKAEVEVEEEMADDSMTAIEKMMAEHMAKFTELADKVEKMEAKVMEYESKFTEINSNVITKAKDTDEKFAKVVELVELISKEDAVEVEPVKNQLFKAKKESGNDVLAKYVAWKKDNKSN